MRLYVIDDGMGIPADGQTVDGHFGMELMQELAEDLGGTLKIDSEAGKGTRIEAYLPLLLPAEHSTSNMSGLAASEVASMDPVAVGNGLANTGEYPTRTDEVG